MLFASLFAFAADLVPASRRIEGIALFGVSGMLPISLGGLLGDAILARAGYHELFIAAAVLGAIAVALSLPLRDVPRLEHESPARGILAAAFQRDLLPIWFMGGVFATALASYFTFLKTFVLHAGFGSIGVFFTLYSVSAVLLRVFFGSLPDRVGPKRMLLPALASLVAGLLVLACATSSTEVALAGVLCGLGHGYTFPILLGLVVGRARSSERGAALALFTALFDGGTLVGGPLFGVLIQTLSYRPMFATAAGFVVVAAGIFSVWDRRGRCAARP